MEEHQINPLTWFSERKLAFRPKHFVVVKTPITTESELWIYNNLTGRFCLEELSLNHSGNLIDDFFGFDKYPAFEDPKEAMLFELTWS